MLANLSTSKFVKEIVKRRDGGDDWGLQCDQMVKLCSNIWPLAAMKITPDVKQICQFVYYSAKLEINRHKVAKDLKIFAIVVKFCQIVSHCWRDLFMCRIIDMIVLGIPT